MTEGRSDISTVWYSRIVKRTHAPERKMYMKLKKKELVTMLMECQRIIKLYSEPIDTAQYISDIVAKHRKDKK